MECIICAHHMVQTRGWRYRCPACDFEKSTLSSGAGRGIEGLETLRRRNFQIIIEELRKLAGLKNLKCLEVGCAEGWFMQAMTETGVEISAIEPSGHAMEMQNKGYRVIHGFFPDVLPQGEKYDLIAFNDVFEHLPDPVPALKKCEEHLNAGGFLLLNLPNRNGFFYRCSVILALLGIRKPFERLWQKDFPSPHMTYFSDSNLELFIKKYSGLETATHFFLPTIAREGLKERVEASYKGILEQVIYVSLLVLLLIIKWLPQDIMVFIFQKKSCSE